MPSVKVQSGVMLIEALVGILIFSIGILALIGMQGAAMKNTNDARYRSEAALFATQIIGQMWVDLGNLPNYDTDAGAFAARDDWRNTVAARLPGITVGGARSPTIQVGPDATLGLSDREVRVQVQWQQPGETQTHQVILLNRINGPT